VRTNQEQESAIHTQKENRVTADCRKKLQSGWLF
jgi:hypothetical protein